MQKKIVISLFVSLTLSFMGCYDTIIVKSDNIRKELDYKDITFLVAEEDGSTQQYKTNNGLCSIINDTLTGRAIKDLDNGTRIWTQLSVPASRILYFEVEELNAAKTIMLTGTIVGGTAALIGAIASSSSSSKSSSKSSNSWGSGRFSCPLIYTLGDSGYKLESETFAGALFKGIERSSYDVLSHLSPAEGMYKLKLVNAREETEYVNHLKLLSVDHPADVSIIPDYFGNLHSVSNPLQPLMVLDERGNVITEVVNCRDNNYWESDLKSVNVNNDEDLVDNLTLEFPKPINVKTAKIILSGLNTELAYFALEKVFALQGENRIEWYNQLDSDPEERAKFVGWLMREGMLHLSVWDGIKWSERGVIPDVGPGVEKTQITLLNIADISCDILKIKISFRTGLWRINQVAVDYSTDFPFKVQELMAYSAVNEKGQDISNLIGKSDSAYYVTVNGEYADIYFSVPPQSRGLSRTIIAKTQGFYNQWGLENKRSQPEIVEKILTEHLFGSRLFIPWWFKENAEQASAAELKYE